VIIDPIKAIKIKVGYLLKSLLLTPTNYLLIKVPIAGIINEWERFIVPVKNANIVPSILGGVILPNRAIIGKINSVYENVLKIMSVKKRKTKSGIPH